MKCKQCNFETPMVSDFRHHMYLIHNAKKPNFHRCENCNEKFYNFEDLVIHREGKCVTDLHDVNSEDPTEQQESDQANDEIKLEESVRLPFLELERLTAEEFAKHSPTIVTSASSQKIRMCVICKSHISQKNLITHIRHIHVNCNTFKCSLCVKGFNDKTALNNHIILHHTSIRPFLCTLCGALFSAKRYVVPHVLGCLKNNWKNCNTFSQTVDDYVEEITEEVPCPMCKAVCSNYLSLINHMKRHRIVNPGDKVKIAAAPEPEKKLHECEICAAKFSDLGKLVVHKRAHQISTGVAVKRFRKKLKQANQMKVTIKNGGSHGNGIVEAEDNSESIVNTSTTEIGGKGKSKVYLCNYPGCQYVSKNDANMKRHKRCVHKEGIAEFNKDRIAHSCHLCSYVTNQQGNLVRHQANHHDIGELQKCNICSFESFSKEKLKNHMKKVHHVKPSTTCKGCSREFKTHYEMKVHQWQHLRENTSCGDGDATLYVPKPKSKSKKSNSNPTAGIDKEMANNQSPNKQIFECTDCGKQFIRQRYLQKHIECVHTKSDDDEEPVEMVETTSLPLETQEQDLPVETPMSDSFNIEPDEFAALNFSSQEIRVIEIDAI